MEELRGELHAPAVPRLAGEARGALELEALALGDVAQNAEVDRSVREVNLRHPELDRDRRPVGAAPGHLARPRPEDARGAEKPLEPTLPDLSRRVGEELRDALPQQALELVAEHREQRGVAALDHPLGVDGDHPVVGAAEHRAELRLAVDQRGGVGALLGHVAGNGEDPPLVGHGPRVPREPAVAAVGAAVPVLEVDGRGARGERRDLALGGGAVVGVHEVEKGPALEGQGVVPQHPRERGVDPQEVPLEVRDAHEVDREREELLQISRVECRVE
ncbi:MAG: hypothetical protein R3A48_05850 [Polyangiales bacterium]